mmetsp:Transcript_19084/g.53887  ORF Transcript_19084/g.53887 Transcript_19084/m.53887 type:complete len:324 (+) Transcript_19084:182-1153(+)
MPGARPLALHLRRPSRALRGELEVLLSCVVEDRWLGPSEEVPAVLALQHVHGVDVQPVVADFRSLGLAGARELAVRPRRGRRRLCRCRRRSCSRRLLLGQPHADGPAQGGPVEDVGRSDGDGDGEPRPLRAPGLPVGVAGRELREQQAPAQVEDHAVQLAGGDEHLLADAEVHDALERVEEEAPGAQAAEAPAHRGGLDEEGQAAAGGQCHVALVVPRQPYRQGLQVPLCLAAALLAAKQQQQGPMEVRHEEVLQGADQAGREQHAGNQQLDDPVAEVNLLHEVAQRQHRALDVAPLKVLVPGGAWILPHVLRVEPSEVDIER